ncbi:hypothetical protein [Dyella sp. Tek66A03]|uniref:hypothetical protein n=1 Tax=Dyella sp. Tek66A03 TaxID=3458298 RepID=UPI00403E6258
MADSSHRDMNGDCVVEYDASLARSRCYSEKGTTETVSAYEVIGPGQLRVTPIDAVTGQAKAPPTEMRYRIDEDWLLIDRQFAPSASSESKQPTALRSVSVRVGAKDNAHCDPHGETHLRVGRSPASSLALSVPRGWQSFLVDPAANRNLARTVDKNLFIGAFVPIDTKAQAIEPSQLIVVVDDVRPGPVPVRSFEFKSVKERFASELGAARLTCDQPDRACAFLQMPDGVQIYTELAIVNGRVVMVSGTDRQSQSDGLSHLEKSVGTFVQRLRSDNTK